MPFRSNPVGNLRSLTPDMVFSPRPRFRLYTDARSYLAVARGFLSGPLRTGAPVARLERELGDRLGAGHVLAVNQARVGIYLVLKNLVSEARPKVIVSPFTLYEVVNMVICAGGEPVFVDIEPGSATPTAAAISELIDDQTAAVMVTHYHGIVRDIDAIVALCADRGVKLVEDVAIAFGTTHRGRAVGTLGDAGIYSFGTFKNVSAFYGGAVVTDDPELFAAVAAENRSYPTVGWMRLLNRVLYTAALDLATWPPVFGTLTHRLLRRGYLNDIPAITDKLRADSDPVARTEMPDAYRQQMSDAQARVILGQLPRIADDIAARIERAAYYHDALGDVPEVARPPFADDGSHAFLEYAIEVPERDHVIRHILRNGGDCRFYYYRNCATLDCFALYKRDCPVATAVEQRILLLPTYPGYPLEESEKLVGLVRDHFA